MMNKRDKLEMVAEARTIGGRLRRLRMARGLSMAEAAAGSGVPPSTLCYYENDKTEPGIHNAVALARFYGVLVEWIAEGALEG